MSLFLSFSFSHHPINVWAISHLFKHKIFSPYLATMWPCVTDRGELQSVRRKWARCCPQRLEGVPLLSGKGPSLKIPPWGVSSCQSLAIWDFMSLDYTWGSKSHWDSRGLLSFQLSLGISFLRQLRLHTALLRLTTVREILRDWLETLWLSPETWQSFPGAWSRPPSLRDWAWCCRSLTEQRRVLMPSP